MNTTTERPDFDAATLGRIGDLIDRVVSIDIKGRGAVSVLYDAVRGGSETSLSLRAAQRLMACAGHGDAVILATGFPVRPWIDQTIGETDGPPGVAALCRALSAGFRAIPVVTVPPAMRRQVEDALRAGAVLPLDYDAAQRAAEGPRPTCSAVIVDYTTDCGRAEQFAAEIMERFRPVLIAAVEHPGANAENVYHSSVGVDISAGAAKVEPLFALARKRSVPTLSFLDNANEIGAGVLRELAHERIPFARTCACPCGGGMASASMVDDVVVGTTANWAAYAAVAAIAVLLGQPGLAVSRSRDARMIEAVMRSGGVEGVSGSIWPEDGVDGISTRISGHVVDLLAEIVANSSHYQDGKPF